MPAKGQSKTVAGPVDLAANFQLQFAGDFYRYDGSLTTPPCSEGVKWFVMKGDPALSLSLLSSLSCLQEMNEGMVAWKFPEHPRSETPLALEGPVFSG